MSKTFTIILLLSLCVAVGAQKTAFSQVFTPELESDTQSTKIDEESPPLVWFVHGMLVFIEINFNRELEALRKIYPDATEIKLKKWDAPLGPGVTAEAHWNHSVKVAEAYSAELAQEIADLPPEDRQRLVLVGHSLGGRIAIRALARASRDPLFRIRQLILAGTATDFDDPDIPDAVRTSQRTVYNLVNEYDVMLAAYKIAEKHTALGTGCLYPMRPEKFYEISLVDTVSHFGYDYLERLLSSILADDFRNRTIIVPQDEITAHVTTLGNDFFWKTGDEFLGWTLQYHTVTGEYRILNPEKVRRASGKMTYMMSAFQRVKQQLTHLQEFRLPSDNLILPTSEPIVQFDALGSAGWWRDLESVQSWRFQRNYSTCQYRLLDPQNRRRAYGSEKCVREAFRRAVE